MKGLTDFLKLKAISEKYDISCVVVLKSMTFLVL